MPEARRTTDAEGLVVRIDARRCHVEIDGRVHRIPAAGRLFERPGTEKRPLAVGDRVRVRFDENGNGMIAERLPRRNKLARASAGEGRYEQVLVANIDLCLVVASLRKPPFRPALVDRILAGAERGRIPARIVLNKIDLVRTSPERSDARPFQDPGEISAFYEKLGYPCLTTSARSGEGLDRLRDVLAGRVSVFCGLSGVGKSSLLNALEPGLNLRVRPVGTEGRHTTTHAQLHRLSFGAHVVDTPGIRNFGLHGLEPREVAPLFVEFRPFLGACAFSDCAHDREPDCAIKEAVAEGAIAEMRYTSYLALLEEARRGRFR